MRTLILNSGNIVPNTNNSELVYAFPAGSITIKESQQIALATLQMYYSTFNITALNNNNTYQYVWVDGTIVNVLMPDGFYTLDDITNFLQFTMIGNGHYLVSGSNFVYLLNWITNPTYYTIELQVFPIDTTIATANSWTLPASPTWAIPTAQAISPMINILNNNFTKVVGFQTGYYPQGSPSYAQAVISGTPPTQTQTPSFLTQQAYQSTTAPQITPLSSYVLTCNLINNNYSVPNNLLYSFAPQGAFGSQFTIQPNFPAYINVNPGQYQFITLKLLDQNLLPISIQDPNFVIQLIITDNVTDIVLSGKGGNK
jgi:hypothetical protein